MEPVDEPSRARAPRRPFPAPSVGHSPGKVRGRVPGVRVARARESRREAAAVVTDADAGARADADAVWYVERALTDEDVRTVVDFSTRKRRESR